MWWEEREGERDSMGLKCILCILESDIQMLAVNMTTVVIYVHLMS